MRHSMITSPLVASLLVLLFAGTALSLHEEPPAASPASGEYEKKSDPAVSRKGSDRQKKHADGKEAAKDDTSKAKKRTAAKPKPADDRGHHGGSPLTAEESMKLLLDGNRRHAAYRYANPNRTQQCRLRNAKGQHPAAVILGCSDSRVPPEIVFDQGVGDLFVVRTAGHVVDTMALGSMEYAVEHLGVRLIVVLGHERCGAVDATLKGGEASGSIRNVVEAIRPAVEKAKAKPGHSHDCDLLCASVRMNVKQQIENIKKSSPMMAEFIQDGVLKIVGAYYDLDTGEVQLTYIPSLI